MSMNENLEGKVSELTDVIRNLSDKPALNSVDINNIANSLSRRTEENVQRGFERLTDDLSRSLLDRLEEKHSEIKEKLSIFENFAENVGKNVQNPKIDGEIERILNDIEALHSKMNSQEIQTENLIKNFDTFKNSTSAGQITKMCDEITSISTSYDGIVQALNNNFQEFLKRVETLGSKDELQRLSYSIETVEGNQNVLVSAMNSINEKQEEIKTILRQSAYSSGTEKLEQVQKVLNRINEVVTDGVTKADFDIITDKFSSIVALLADLKGSYSADSTIGQNNVLSGQLNNIISQLNSLKSGSSLNKNEDTIKLLTSITDFKDTLYNALNSRISELLASINSQFDKVSNSIINTNLDSNQTMTVLTGEIQKLSNMLADGLNSKTAEINQNFKELGQNNVTTIVNSVKGELSALMSEISTIGNTQGLSELSKNIESLKSGFDINSLIYQVNQIKAGLDFGPIKEQIALLNKDELIKTINQKIDLILNYSEKNEILSKLDEIQSSIGAGADLNSLEAKLISIKEFLTNGSVLQDLSFIKDKLTGVNGLSGDITSFKNIEEHLIDIKRQIEESLKASIEKINDDKQSAEELKEALKTIYKLVLDTADSTKINGISAEIKETMNAVPLKIVNDIERNRAGVENALNTIGDKIAGIDLKLSENGGEKLEEIKEQLETLFEFIKEINSKSINEQIDALKTSLVNANGENTNNIKNTISEFQSAIALSFNAIKSGIEENLNSSKLGDSFTPFFDELSEKLSEKMSSIEALIEETSAMEADRAKTLVTEGFDGFKNDIKSSITNFTEQIIEAKTASLAEIIKNQTNETKIEVSNYMKQESEILGSFFNDRWDDKNQELIDKVSQVISAKENSEARINFVHNITEGLAEILNTTGSLKGGYEANNEILNEISSNIGLINAKLEENSPKDENFEEILTKISKNLEIISSKVSAAFDDNDHGKFQEAVSVLNSEIQDKLNLISANSELMESNFRDITAQNNSDLKGVMNEINNNISDGTNKINDNLIETGANLENALNSVSENMRLISSKFEYINPESGETIIDALDDLNRKIASIQDAIEGVSTQEDSNRDNGLLGLSSMVEQKINDKISVLEALIDDNINKLDTKSKEILDENKNVLGDKFDEFCNLANDNSQAIKDELQMQAETLTDKISNIETLIGAGNNDGENALPNLADVAEDISKIRIGIEKNNKLSNFKEFAARLVELKNINLENAKISRVIGSDIMRFDTWLKNTTAKIEQLAVKIDKSEKVKMDDLKTRLMTEKSQSDSQKLEDTLLSVYKKYRTQETKLDDIAGKIEVLFQKQSEGFDIKEFIDLFYDNMKKQEDIANRMDNLEDKMDLIQAKIDHIISSCIDE